MESLLYEYSFAPNPDWTERYASGPEIWAYLRRCATDFGVRPHLRVGHEVPGLRGDDEGAAWRVATSRGAFTARMVVLAVGAQGPNTGLGHPSVVPMQEAQIDSLPGALRYLERHGATTVEPTAEAQARFVAEVDRRMRRRPRQGEATIRSRRAGPNTRSSCAGRELVKS